MNNKNKAKETKQQRQRNQSASSIVQGEALSCSKWRPHISGDMV